MYREISREQLEACCRAYLGEELVDANLLPGGLFNTTYLLQTKKRNAVLRLGPVNRYLLQPYERKLMEAEAKVLAVLEKRDIPSSSVIALDLSRQILDRDVMVVEALPAVSASNDEWDKTWEKEMCRKAGSLARRFQEITAEDVLPGEKKPFGRLGNVLSGLGGETWAEAIAIEVGQWQELARRFSLVEEAFITRVETVFRRYEALFHSVGEPRLIHADLWYGNILVNTAGELIAIIDCDRAVLGDPEWEFATGWMTGEAFFEGYGREPDAAPESVLRRRLYKLLMNLEDVFVWQCQYNKPEMARATVEGIERELTELEQI